MKRAHIWVSGKVQGVFYRATAKEIAKRLRLKGWVRNLPDGRVEIVAEGDEDALRAFVDWCWEGPPLARVEDVKVVWEEATGEFDDFYVRY
ncbi:acylphosphatase [Thermosulfidibacter takaii ABI70S6]|uniref:acylphosphatase n=1 Tax=Thermosulfidibacter takaii (strain DSM 17441 / JCM 13301 / NBRC 103674 / ABI70S6) TaxID=1298851 RepID=A0A0S3QSR8_THET7|nr:acylphosphatase [Thermosulfidibacter takaii]BAT71395.1 acylphosphatase [Thermosulfidibacter takaii ABI70S6]